MPIGRRRHWETRFLDKLGLQPLQPQTPRDSSFQRWLTVFVFVGSGLVYLSLIFKSAPVFVIGEGVCLTLAPIVLWLERGRIRQWWNARNKCPACGHARPSHKGICPGCGHKDILA
jgi:hypothetical protein